MLELSRLFEFLLLVTLEIVELVVSGFHILFDYSYLAVQVIRNPRSKRQGQRLQAPKNHGPCIEMRCMLMIFYRDFLEFDDFDPGFWDWISDYLYC